MFLTAQNFTGNTSHPDGTYQGHAEIEALRLFDNFIALSTRAQCFGRKTFLQEENLGTLSLSSCQKNQD